MLSVIEDYKELIEKFLDDSVSWQEFRDVYDDKYLNDQRPYSEDL